MATDTQVQQYIAHWFQLGKGIQTHQGQVLKPKRVFYGNKYTAEFEACWQRILQDSECYLEGTDQTIAQLRSGNWEISECSRCTMPVPMVVAGIVEQLSCPCSDLPNWPNNEVPMPRSPIEVETKTQEVRQRLAQANAVATIANPLN